MYSSTCWVRSEQRHGAKGAEALLGLRPLNGSSAIDALDGQVGGFAAAHPLVVQLLVATRANLLVHEEVEVVEQALLLAQSDERHVIGHVRRIALHHEALELAGL